MEEIYNGLHFDFERLLIVDVKGHSGIELKNTLNKVISKLASINDASATASYIKSRDDEGMHLVVEYLISDEPLSEAYDLSELVVFNKSHISIVDIICKGADSIQSFCEILKQLIIFLDKHHNILIEDISYNSVVGINAKIESKFRLYFSN